MKYRSSLITALLAVLLPLGMFAQAPQDIPWYGNKYSMFIHFGLYSTLGGVWEGRQVQGYSEQIQSHGGIYGDAYSELAYDFNPLNFNADSLVALARRAGMRSIVITSKHHDGFCLFRTATTDFNSWDGAPCHRDFMAELSDACRRGGVAFGLYFSLIDWHAPCADHITSHNATFITPEHHRLNLAQVEELVTQYGSISELWFDMGSLTPQQSKDLYDLVRRHQPDCMISGRLGNGCYDFAVMSDNYYPEASLQTPWQSAASMFNETWGYRSWQQRGDPSAKAREKLCSLIGVVSGGGNFLLNIGPMGDGSVVPFEKQVLEEIGSWLSANGDVIYNTQPSPFPRPFDWGCITRNGKRINLILSGKAPTDGQIEIPVGRAKLKACEGPAKLRVKGGVLRAELSGAAYEGDVKVLRIDLDRELAAAAVASATASATVSATASASATAAASATATAQRSAMLAASASGASPAGRVASSSYFCQDYYTNARSEVAYTWPVNPKQKISCICLSYTASDIGKVVDIELGGKLYQLELGADLQCGDGAGMDGQYRDGAGADGAIAAGSSVNARVPVSVDARVPASVTEHDRYVTQTPKHYFESPQHYDFKPVAVTDGYRKAVWNLIPQTDRGPALDSAVLASRPFETVYVLESVSSPAEQDVVFEVGAGNGVQLYLNGDSVMKHLNSYRCTFRSELVRVHLQEGENQLVLRSYNRFEKTIPWLLRVAEDQQIYCSELRLSPVSGVESVSIRAHAPFSLHEDCQLHNLRIELR